MSIKALPKLHVASPCTEDWAKMTPTTQGRYCSSCEKVVHDFTRMTDDELIAYFSTRQQGKACGVFRPDQLSDSKPHFDVIHFFRTYIRHAAITLLGFFSLKTAGAQNGSAEPAHLRTDVCPTTNGSSHPDTLLHVFSGKVTNAKTGEAISLATITLQPEGSEKVLAAFSQPDGSYNIKMPANLATGTFTLLVTQQGYRDFLLAAYTITEATEDIQLYPSQKHYRRKGLFRSRHRKGKYRVMGAYF